MVTVPAFVWRGGSICRALTVGLAVGLFLGALAWIDSGLLLGGVIACVILTVFYGTWMARRMAHYWPSAKQLSGADRQAVATAARRGERIDDPRLAQPVIDYSRGMRASAENARPLRWLLVVILVVGVGTALWDAVYGSWGNAVASGIYLVMLLVELFWWPNRQEQLLANADRAADLAARIRDEERATETENP